MLLTCFWYKRTNRKLEKTYSPDFLFSSKNNYTVKRIHIRHFSLHNTDKREMLEFTPIQEKKLSSHGEYLENIYFPKSHVHQLFYFDLKYWNHFSQQNNPCSRIEVLMRAFVAFHRTVTKLFHNVYFLLRDTSHNNFISKCASILRKS